MLESVPSDWPYYKNRGEEQAGVHFSAHSNLEEETAETFKEKKTAINQ